jgi:hypothetical protein
MAAHRGADLAGDEARDSVVIEAVDGHPVHRDKHVVYRKLRRAALGIRIADALPTVSI